MRIIVTEATPEAMLTLAGELDIEAGVRLRRAVHDLLRRGERRIVVDIAGVTFLDSAGVRALLFCHNLTAGSRGVLTVTGRSPAVERLLGILDRPWVNHVLWPEPTGELLREER